jgi:RNA polymerase sigma factor (sigma-70 family)
MFIGMGRGELVSVPGAVEGALSELLASSTSLDEQRRHVLCELYRKHWTGICGYVRAHFGAGPPEPEDVAQSAFARYATLDSGRIENPQAFLYATARNLVIDHRRRARRERASIAFQIDAETFEPVSDLTPENVLAQSERFRILAEALEQVPASRRRMVLLNRFEGLSYGEIGRRFGMSSEAVRKQVERTLAACLKALEIAQSSGECEGKPR